MRLIAVPLSSSSESARAGRVYQPCRDTSESRSGWARGQRVRTGTAREAVEASLSTFEKAIAAYPEVMECYLMTGTSDYLLRVVVSDLQEFQRFVTDVSKIPGIGNIQSSVALKQVKYKTALPLPIDRPPSRRRHSRR